MTIIIQEENLEAKMMGEEREKLLREKKKIWK